MQCLQLCRVTLFASLKIQKKSIVKKLAIRRPYAIFLLPFAIALARTGARCSLLVVRCSLLVVRCSLLVVWCSVFIRYFLQTCLLYEAEDFSTGGAIC